MHTHFGTPAVSHPRTEACGLSESPAGMIGGKAPAPLMIIPIPGPFGTGRTPADGFAAAVVDHVRSS